MRLGILASVLSFGMVAGLAPAADPDSGYQPGPPANDPKPLSLLPVPKIKRAQPMKATEADPRIASEVLKIFEKKPHSMTVLACLPGMNNDNDDAVIQRLVEFLNGPGENDFPYLDCLVAIGERLPDRATEVFQNYIDSRNVERCRYLCVALTKTCGNLSIDLLAPLLSTKARTGYLIVRDGNVEPQRLCDIAASTIAVNFPNLPFDLMDTGERRDQQIKVMKRKIGEMKKAEK